MPHTMRECKKDTLGSIALPKPYSVPSLTGVFQQDMFYWDTYFTNIGLILDADFDQKSKATCDGTINWEKKPS